MLRSMKDLEGYGIAANNGEIGHVRDFYFDDEAWVIRYFVVDTGIWLSSRKVLISPIAIGQPNWAEKVLPVELTRQQIQNSPSIDTEQPVSRQHELDYLRYFGYPFYWGGVDLWGSDANPRMLAQQHDLLDREMAYARADAEAHSNDDIHLRSCKAVVGYHLIATDGDIGHVQGLLVEEETWAIRYLIINTSNWWLGHKVLVAPQWISDISWSGATVSVNLTRQAVKDAPPYDSTALLNRKKEESIFEHYGHIPYWWRNEPDAVSNETKPS